MDKQDYPVNPVIPSDLSEVQHELILYRTYKIEH
jgi:hypothetical protein